MHRAPRLLVGVAALVVTAAVVPSAVPSPSAPPTVRVIDLRPFTIRGNGFRPAERVTIVATVSRTHRRTLRATGTGSFVARFAEYADACTAYNLRVLGSSGRRATLAKKPPLSCAALEPIR